MISVSKRQKRESVHKETDVPFLLTTVQGIDDCFNQLPLAVGIEGLWNHNLTIHDFSNR